MDKTGDFDPYSSQNVFSLTTSQSKVPQGGFTEAQMPDLKVFVSDEAKEPNADNAYLSFTNPSQRIIIKRKETLQSMNTGQPDKDKQKRDPS